MSLKDGTRFGERSWQKLCYTGRPMRAVVPSDFVHTLPCAQQGRAHNRCSIIMSRMNKMIAAAQLVELER